MLKLHFIAVALVLLATLSGCASLPDDGGRSEVQKLVANRTGHDILRPEDNPGNSLDKLLDNLLRQPLTRESAVQIALINNPQIRAQYARLGIAAAAVYDAGRLSNPRLGVAVMSSTESSTASQVTFGLTQSFTDMLLLSSRSRLAEREFERGKQEVSAAIVTLAADVGVAYFAVVGAQQGLAMRSAVASAAQVSAKLAQRFLDAGNISPLEVAVAQAAASQAQIDTLRAKAEMESARNVLNRLMGLTGSDTRWTQTDQLRLPVRQEDDIADLLLLAQQSRLDLAAARTQLELLADSLGITRSFRYIGEIGVGVETERETDRSRITGPNLSVELPIFNTGEGRIAHAEAQLDQAEAQWRLLALNISNDVQLAHSKVLSSRSLAQLYQQSLLPQRQAVVRYTQQEFNYMLTGQFALLQAKQQEYEAYQGYLEALRDYWIARTELERAVGAQLPSAAEGSPETVEPIHLDTTVPADASHMHHNSPSHTTPPSHTTKGVHE